MSATQVHRPAAILTTLPTDTLLLRGFTGEEQLSRPFRYLVDLSSKDPAIDFDSVVGQPACIRLELAGREPRHFHGIVSRFVQIPGEVDEVRYQAEIVPWLWLLTRTADCRIHQEQTVIEIVEDVFRRFGFTDYRLRLSRRYRKREYCVQYRETAFDFVSRLLESEGITYFFEHAEQEHLLVLSDSPAGHGPFPGYDTVRWHPAGATTPVPETIRRWVYEKQLQPSTYVHTEYNFTKPRADLKAAARFPGAVPGHEWEVFDYPGEYEHLDDGETYANLRAEEFGAAQDVYQGEGDVRGLATGHTFELTDHPRRDQNQSYLITGLQLKFDQAAYLSGARDAEATFECAFSCLPAQRPFRPRRITRKPVVHGEQTAVVVGAAGKEIEVDDYARVKVHFFWDRHNRHDESASCWLRVSQPWAGKGYGSMNVPRVGVEVIVSFLEGDPDRPIITGRVYNKATMPHASNAGRDGKPGNAKPSGIAQAAAMTSFKSESTPGGGGSNEITMNDTAGAEGLFIKAQRDEVHDVGHDCEEKVANNLTTKIGNNSTIDVGCNAQETVGVAKVVQVGDTLVLRAGTSITLQCGASTLHMNQAGFITLSGTVISTAAAINASITAPVVTLTGAMALSISGALVWSGSILSRFDAAAGFTIKAGGDVSVSGANILLQA
jgi:type VI secretion system secreted protein VgrG